MHSCELPVATQFTECDAGSDYEPLLPEAQPPCSHTPSTTCRKLVHVHAGQMSMSSDPIATQFMRDRGSRGGEVGGYKATLFPPRTSEHDVMFSPRSREALAGLTPRRREFMLRAFPLRRQSVHSMAPSVSMDRLDVLDTDCDPEEVKVRAFAVLHTSSMRLSHTCSLFHCLVTISRRNSVLPE